jgi:hypothetical protein
VVYSDESAISDTQPLTVVAAMMLNMDSQWHPVCKAVEQAIIDALGKTQGEVDRYEIRAKDLYRKIRGGHEPSRQLMRRLMDIPHKCCVPVFQGLIYREDLEFVLKRSGFSLSARHAFQAGATSVSNGSKSICMH